MAQDSNLTTLHQSAPLDALEIERTLNRLWGEYRDQEGAGLAARARLATLIAYCRTRSEAEAATNAVTALNNVRPVRSIIVSTEPGVSGAAEASATLRCGISGSSHICFEEIMLHTPGETLQALPSLLEPLTVADLPVYLWFPGEPPLTDPGIERLVSVADRVVTDSHAFEDALTGFGRLAALVERLRGQCVFTEMTWTRMATWREAIGKLFDPVPSRRFVPRIASVDVTCSPGLGNPSDRGLLIVGWLAAKLGWRPVSMKRGSTPAARFVGENGPVIARWKEGTQARPGYLLSIVLNAGEVEFHVRRHHDDPTGAIHSITVCSGEEQPGPAYQPPHLQTHELLCHALDIRTPFADWEDALAAIAILAANQGD